MFKVGEKIICIDKQSPNKFHFHLTENKVYVVYNSLTKNESVVWVKNDTGIITEYPTKNFMSISEYRRSKIEKICSKLEKK